MVVVAAAVAVMAYVQEKSLKFSNFLPNTSIAKNVILTREMKMRPFRTEAKYFMPLLVAFKACSAVAVFLLEL